MGKKTKSEHYVPRCYLKRWANEKKQVYVFDKVLKKERISNYEKVACKRYFYDISSDKISDQQKAFLKKNGIDPEEEPQFIEKFLGKVIEDPYEKLLDKIIQKISTITPWYEKECFFVSKREKVDLSVCLAIQFIRTDKVRSDIYGLADCLEQALMDKNVSERVIERYIMKEGDEKNVHGDMILNMDYILKLAERFDKLSWILRINKTEKLFYTSDSPIVTIPHVKNSYMSMSGVNSEGIEIFIPISPMCILVMYDGNYHKDIEPHDRRYVSITDMEDVDHYNTYTTCMSGRTIL